MSEKKKSSAATKTKKVTPKRLSNTVRPQEMTLEDWQIALRKQAAEKEVFDIRKVSDKTKPGYFSVRRAIMEKNKLGNDGSNEKKIVGYGEEHTVVYRGEGSQWNYCSCMDFKASGLGTCQHLEAVKLYLGDKKASAKLPATTSLYVDYKGKRRIRLRIGSDMHKEMQELAKPYFTATGELRVGKEERIPEFIAQAQQLLPSFRCYGDVATLLRKHQQEKMLAKLANSIKDNEITALLKTQLYPYQMEGVRFALRHGRSIIADEMGLGKTIQAITTAEVLRSKQLITSVLVVCPTSLKYQWKYEIERFTNSTVRVVEGNALKRKELYAQDDSFYKIVSYHSMSNDVKLMGEITTDMLILDEVQRLKNWDTQIAKAARHIVSEYAVVLSGTPLENKLEELYSIVELVDQYALSPYYQFRDKYIITDDAGMTIGYRNLNDISVRLKDLLIRRKKVDVALDMPLRRDKMLIVPMTKEQAAQHEDFKQSMCMLVQKWRRYKFLSDLDRQRLMLLLSQMRMVANSTFILDQKTRFDTKVDEVVNILQDVFASSDEKVVIFSCWERMTRLIAAELDKMGIGYENLNGSVPSEKRGQMVERFRNDPNSRVFISTDAGATGLNLQSASIIINMELPWNPAILEQRIGRIFRLGQQRNVQVINLVSALSIEEEILGKLQFKSALFEGILDNGESTVMLPDKSTFQQIMETLDAVVDDKTVPADHGTSAPADNEDVQEEELKEGVQLQLDTLLEETASQPLSETAAIVPPDSPAALVQQGIGFFSQLAQTLSSPEKTQQLVNTIVKTDEQTGETSLRIPIPNKDTVSTLLQSLGTLLNGLGKVQK